MTFTWTEEGGKVEIVMDNAKRVRADRLVRGQRFSWHGKRWCFIERLRLEHSKDVCALSADLLDGSHGRHAIVIRCDRMVEVLSDE